MLDRIIPIEVEYIARFLQEHIHGSIRDFLMIILILLHDVIKYLLLHHDAIWEDRTAHNILTVNEQ